MPSTVRHIILAVIDFFHRPFARWIDTQTFRYLACGGSNAVFNIAIASFTAHYLHLRGKDLVPVGPFMITREIVAWLIAFVITTPIGFFLMRSVVFPESNIRGRHQLIRYIMLVVFCVGLNYILIKFFTDVCHFIPLVTYTLTNGLIAVFSYISQRVFTFAVKEAPAEP